MPPRPCLALLSLALAACGATPASPPDASSNCDLDDRDEEFVAGMEKTGDGGVVFRLVSSNPAPPYRGENLWVLELEDASGAPLSGAEVGVSSFMPDHNHFSQVTPEIVEDPATPGRYQLDPIYLFMPGTWEVTLRATPAGGAQDDVMFTFCIRG
jgi:hypothetical protein